MNGAMLQNKEKDLEFTQSSKKTDSAHAIINDLHRGF